MVRDKSTYIVAYGYKTIKIMHWKTAKIIATIVLENSINGFESAAVNENKRKITILLLMTREVWYFARWDTGEIIKNIGNKKEVYRDYKFLSFWRFKSNHNEDSSNYNEHQIYYGDKNFLTSTVFLDDNYKLHFYK